MGEKKQVVIIGNGFDLQCGLETSYQKFMQQSRYDKIRKTSGNRNLENIKNLLKEYTIWEILFCDLEELENWCDVESIISEALDFVLRWLEIERKQHENLLGGYSDYYDPDEWLIEHHRSFSTIFIAYVDYVNNIFVRSHDGTVSLNYEECKPIFDELLKELTRFEEIFSKYVQEKIAENANYEKNAKLLLQQLKLISFNDEKGGELKIEAKGSTLLSFNYTNLFLNSDNSTFVLDRQMMEKLKGKYDVRNAVEQSLDSCKADNFPLEGINLVNIHGTFEQVIFGIDQKAAEGVGFKYRFTKTARLLFDLKKRSVFLPYLLQDADQIKSIGFFGHSLSEADYSYFQAIFDAVNLYAEKVELTFYFVNYDEKSNVRESETTRIFRLINKYGETLNNKDHGKNLLHKLILENRIIIKEIEGIV